MNRLLVGALAGLVATAPMTALMLAWHRRLPPQERYPLPPAEITMKVAEEVGVDDHLDTTEERLAAALAAHFAYGAAGGAAYAAAARGIPLPPAVKGGIFGLGIWTVSYLGWLPALGILSSAKHHPARRNTLMIVANALWGAVTALLAERRLEPEKPDG